MEAFQRRSGVKDGTATSQVGGKMVVTGALIFLSQTDFSPAIAKYAGSAHVFAMRSATTPEDKIVGA